MPRFGCLGWWMWSSLKGKTVLVSKKSDVTRNRGRGGGKEEEREKKNNEKTTPMMEIESTQKRCTCVQEIDKRKARNKDWHCVARDCTKLRKTENLCRKRDSVASRVIRRRIRCVPSTDECNFSRMLWGRKTAGNRKRDRRVRVTRERENKAPAGHARLARVFVNKKARSYLTHDGERLMPFDESRCPPPCAVAYNCGHSSLLTRVISVPCYCIFTFVLNDSIVP